MRVAGFVCCSLLAVGCSNEPPSGPAALPQQPKTNALPALEHDFGTIPHGESREHEFTIDPNRLGEGFVPLRAVLDCSCGHADLRIRRADGTDRTLDGSPLAENALRLDERLLVRIVLDTAQKEALDLPPTTSRGQVLLQRFDDPRGRQRVSWPILVRYAIDAPVVLEPFAALDFASVPTSIVAETSTTLRGDERHPGLQFTGVSSSDPAIEVALRKEGERVRLVATCKGGEIGHHRAAITVTTDDPKGYRILLPTTWKVVPDLEAKPLPKITFRADLSRPQREDEAKNQYIVVRDHDLSRSPEFTVHEIVDDDSRSAAASFAVTLTPVPGQPREHRLHVRYLGGRTETFRGRLVLTKHGADGPFLPIELAVFPVRDS